MSCAIVGASPAPLPLQKEAEAVPAPSAAVPRSLSCRRARENHRLGRRNRRTEELRRPPSARPCGQPSPSRCRHRFPRCENPLARLYLPVPLFSRFLVSSTVAARTENLRLPSMATAATAAPSGHLFGPALIPPLLCFFPVPSDMYSVAREALTALVGVLHAASNGGLPRLPQFRPASLLLSSPVLFLAVPF